MDTNTLLNINKIIERDSKTTTYKFALLRGVIDIIQENSPYISYSDERVHLPTGLMIEKWMIYYYPILESSTPIPQIGKNIKLAFEPLFNIIIDHYRNKGGFSVFYNDLKNKGLPEEIKRDFLSLAKSLRRTITDNPMRFIGKSVTNEDHSIFQKEMNDIIPFSNTIDVKYLIEKFGTFSIPVDYFNAFKILGSFICGQDSILFKWAEFSVKSSGHSLSFEKVISEILESPITDREIAESKLLYRALLERKGKVFCVWSGKRIKRYDIDHIIPFSIWKNNDLWNLLPSQPSINKFEKKDKIPSPELIEKSKDLILDYWSLIFETNPVRFEKEIQIALLGNTPFNEWEKTGIEQLQNTCKYLISKRGYDDWNIKSRNSHEKITK